MTTSRFERDTGVEAVGDGRYRGTIDPGWAPLAEAAPNGGYLLALAARAMRDPVPHPDPVTVTAHYLAAPGPGSVDIEVEVIRTGRRHSTVGGRLRQDGRECVRLLATFGDLGAAGGVTRVDRSPPELPPLDACVDAVEHELERSRRTGVPPPPILERFDHRMPLELLGWVAGRPTGRGETGGYVQWADGAAMDTLGLLVVADCYPPAVFNLSGSGVGWVPTIELTVQVRARPAAGYLTARMTTGAITSGYLEEDGELWDASGALVALSRQLALVPRRGEAGGG